MILNAVIEDPRGATARHYLDAATGLWRTFHHPRARSPWPANYGFLLDTHNPADDDPLDTLVLAVQAFATGTELPVRPVALLLRPDGDHKVIAAAIEDLAYRDIRWLREVPRDDVARIERWFAEWTAVMGWRDAGDAERLVSQSR